LEESEELGDSRRIGRAGRVEELEDFTEELGEVRRIGRAGRIGRTGRLQKTWKN
jgi:hypothetical protein